MSATFTATLSAVSGRAVTVNYATANSSAVAPGDFSAATGSLSFAAGVTTQTVTVLVNGDELDENDENFFLNLSNALNASILDAQGLGTITDDDPLPSVAIGDVTVTEGDTGTVTASFNVTLAPASGRQVSVSYATADGTATASADYSATSGELTFAAGETTKQVTVPVHNDVLDEIDESFTVGLSSPVDATISDDLGLGTITDNDPLPALSINDVTVTEGDGGSINANFTVSLGAPSGRLVTVDYATANGTATAPADYQAGNGTVSFPAGQTAQQVSIQVNGDLLDEIDESFLVNLTNAPNAVITDPQGVGTITDNDPLPELAVNDVTVTEGDAGTVNANFTVSLNAPSGRPVSVAYATANGTAIAPADYTAIAGTVNLAAGQTSQQVSVAVNADLLDEDNEDFTINLSSPVDATIADPQGLGSITDNDPLPALSVNDVTVTEGNSGTTNAVFTVTLGAPSAPDRNRRLRDRGRERDVARRLRGSDRPADVRAGADDPHGHRAGQRRPRQRGHGDLLPQPLEPRQRNDRGPPGRRDDHRRRRRADALGQRRHGRRGQCGLGQRNLHGLADAGQRSDGQRRLLDARRDGDLAGRLHSRRRQPRLPARPDDADIHGARSTATCSTRSTRTSPSTSPIRSTRSSGTGTASARSPTTTRCRPWRSTTSPSPPRATPERSTRPSQSA